MMMMIRHNGIAVCWVSRILVTSFLFLLLLTLRPSTTAAAFQQQSTLSFLSSSSSSLAYRNYKLITTTAAGRISNRRTTVTTQQQQQQCKRNRIHPTGDTNNNNRIALRLQVQPQNEEEVEQLEIARLNIWQSRRSTIRSMLRGAESLKNFRLSQGYVPPVDPITGTPIKETNVGGKSAVTWTAFAVTMGVIVLRVGGRAALVSAVGLDFLTDNPELQSQVTQLLEASDSADPLVKGVLFCLAWTIIKVLCFDGGGVVLALSSGILFGGVVPGTLMSAFGATIGSSVAFGLAKADTPVRKKAIELVQDNPSLRGIEKVVAEDGLKAVLTLRLAPILPIPLGMYNYVYGISNVKYLDFAGGIFLGSLKPYLLDSYLGYFGKSLVDGSAAAASTQDGGLQDYILVGVLGLSVLIGVFASQLASETWDAVLQEQAEASNVNGTSADDPKTVMTEFFGFEFPRWVVGFQYALHDADERINTLVLQEYDAKVWNYTVPATNVMTGTTTTTTTTDNSPTILPDSLNPAKNDVSSPEIIDRYKGIDLGASTCDGLVLSPILFGYFLQFSDPLFDETQFLKDRQERELRRKAGAIGATGGSSGGDNGGGGAPSNNILTTTTIVSSTPSSVPATTSSSIEQSSSSSSSSSNNLSIEGRMDGMLDRLQLLREETQERLNRINMEMNELENNKK
jgi:uncharacterized membrane protein YdjX (TVP38/TMEM64 family)